MKKRNILKTAALLMACGLLMSGCGSSGSAKGSSGAAAGTSAAADQAGEARTFGATETKAEETKAEESKAEESQAEETKAEETKAEETKAEEPKAESTEAAEADNASAADNKDAETEEDKASENGADENAAGESGSEESGSEGSESKDSEAAADEAGELNAEEAQPTEVLEAPSLLHPLLDDCRLDYYDEKLETFISYQNYPAVHLSEKEAYAWPDLSDALEEWNASRYHEAVQTQKDLLKASEDIRENMDEEDLKNAPYAYSEYYDRTHALISRADTRALSILCHYENYAGGVHGYYANWGASFDTATGRELTVQDVVRDMDQLAEVLGDKLTEQYPDLVEETVRNYLEEACGTKKEGTAENAEAASDADETAVQDLCWNLSPQGITFYFNPYLLSGYAAGMQIVTVPYREYPEMFAEKYAESVEDYIMPLEKNQDNFVDVDSDGKAERLAVVGNYGEGGNEFTSLTMTIGDESFTIDGYPGQDEEEGFWAYDITPYLVCKDKKTYLYIFSLSDNDYQILSSYDITGGSPEPVEMMNAGIPAESWDEGLNTYTAFVDPDAMRLYSRLFVVGTVEGIRSYHIEKDGKWAPNSEIYELGAMTLVVKARTELSLVGPDGHFIEPIPLEKGTKLMMYRTDGATWMDFLCFDNGSTEIIRAELQYEDNQWKLNYVPAEDVFEYIPMAG